MEVLGEQQQVLVQEQQLLVLVLVRPLVLVQAASSAELAADTGVYCLSWLVEEVSMSVNTAAAGGNASLMTIG